MGKTGTEREAASLHFADFVVDPDQRSVHRGATTITLTPKTWAVLYYLASHHERVVTKDELFAAAWPDTVVSDGTLSWCIKEIRRVLNDTGRRPRYVKTVYGQGYRFIAPIPTPAVEASHAPHQSLTGFVGRTTELTRLQELWAHVGTGRPQIGFLTGEAGIGKTTLVAAFLERLSTEPVLIGQGQCVEQYGAGEAYHPVLEALSQLARGPGRGALEAALRTHAPSWLPHLATLLSAEERETLAARHQGTTQTQALRELADALEALALHQPVVLVLEDLHWSDTATLAFLSALARRPQAGRLLVLATHRPVDPRTTEHLLRALKAELQLHGLCAEVALAYLDEADVHAYATHRFGADGSQVAADLHARSGGNPLFLVNLADYLERHTDPADAALHARWETVMSVVPDQIRAFVGVQVERLSRAELRVLEAASVNGTTFVPSLVAAALAQAPDEVEQICESLEQQGRFLEELGPVTWPDRSVATQYRFQHALYREVLYQRLGDGQRRRLHRSIGERLEAGYGDKAGDVAAELAQHFERGHAPERAAKYFARAGETALRRGAHQEVVLQSTNGLAQLEALPAGPARRGYELQLQTLAAQGYAATKSHTAPEVERALLRARDLSEEAGDQLVLLIILLGLFHLYHGRSSMLQARELADAAMVIATEHEHPVFTVGARYMVGVNALYRGMLDEAQVHLDAVAATYDSELHKPLILMYGFNLGVICLLFRAITLALRGYPDTAIRQLEDALGLEHEMTHPFTNVYAHCVAPLGYHCLRNDEAMTATVEAGVTLGTQQGLPIWIAFGTVLRGYGQVAQGNLEPGIAEMRAGLASMAGLGAQSQWLHYMTMLAEAVARTGEYPQALQHLEDALGSVHEAGEHFYEPETWRVKGEMLARSSATGAEECLQKALELARQQGAALFELRAAASLARLWQQTGHAPEARRLLAPVYERFTEGFDTPDLRDARGTLAAL